MGMGTIENLFKDNEWLLMNFNAAFLLSAKDPPRVSWEPYGGFQRLGRYSATALWARIGAELPQSLEAAVRLTAHLWRIRT